MSAETALERVQRLNAQWRSDPTKGAVSSKATPARALRRRAARAPRTVPPRESAVITALKNFRENGFPGTSIMDNLSFRNDELPF